MTEHRELTVGTRVYYTGDAANHDGFGKIVRQYQDRWGEFVDIDIDESAEPFGCLGISAANFNGPGARFMLRSVYDARLAQHIAQMT